MKVGNSIRKTGPRTKRGKAVAKLNAITHGVTALSVPAGEQAAFKDHRASFLEAYSPANAVESFLVDRIAMTAWRMRRLDAWEAFRLESARRKAASGELYREDAFELQRMAIAAERGEHLPVERMTMPQIRLEIGAHEPDEADHYLTSAASLEELAKHSTERAAEGEAVTAFALTPEPAKLEAKCGEVGAIVLNTLTEELERRGVAGEVWAAAALGEGEHDEEAIAELVNIERDADPGEVWRLWEFAVRELGTDEYLEDAKEILLRESARRRFTGTRLAALARRAVLLIQEAEQAAIVPPENDHARFQRYDAGLERSLFKAMHELEALQEKRRGGAAPLARVEVHGNEGRD